MTLASIPNGTRYTCDGCGRVGETDRYPVPDEEWGITEADVEGGISRSEVMGRRGWKIGVSPDVTDLCPVCVKEEDR